MEILQFQDLDQLLDHLLQEMKIHQEALLQDLTILQEALHQEHMILQEATILLVHQAEVVIAEAVVPVAAEVEAEVADNNILHNKPIQRFCDNFFVWVF